MRGVKVALRLTPGMFALIDHSCSVLEVPHAVLDAPSFA